MPTFKKQHPSNDRTTATGQTALAGGPHTDHGIVPLQASTFDRMKVSLYGSPKVGKTRLACTFPKPLLILGTEDGTESVKGTAGVYFCPITTTEEFLARVRGPVLAGDWATVVLDTATKLRDIRVAELIGLAEVPVLRPNARQYRDAYMAAAGDMKDLLHTLLDVPRLRPLNVIVIAQEQTYGGDEEGGGPSDLLKPSVGSALGKSVSDFLFAECDYNGQCLIRQRTEAYQVNVAGKTVTQTRRTGEREYCLRIQPDEVYRAGWRIPLTHQGPVPDFLVDPSHAKIIALLKGTSGLV